MTEPLLIILCQTLYVFHLYHHVSLSAGRYGKYASIAVFAWGSTSVDCANSLTMMLVIETLILYLLCLLFVSIGVCLAKGSFCDFRSLNSSITATDVEYVESEGGRISSTVQNVVMLHACCVLHFIFKETKLMYILPFYDAYIFDHSLYLFGLSVPLHALPLIL